MSAYTPVFASSEGEKYSSVFRRAITYPLGQCKTLLSTGDVFIPVEYDLA